MSEVLLLLAVFLLTFAIGYVLITRVPPMLHTPLMSMTNAISAVTILGALLLFAELPGTGAKAMGAAALASAAFNLAGGFMVTDRMLGFFRRKASSTPEE